VEFFRRLFAADFMPHGHCYQWRPEILWLHVSSDALICLSYYAIPVALIVLVRRRPDLRFSWIFYLFGGFICFCGTSHLIAIVTTWNPAYRFEGVWKAATAAISVATAIIVWPLLPRIVALPSIHEFKHRNDLLLAEIERREQAEQDLHALNEGLEAAVRGRTQELEKQRDELERAYESLNRTADELESYASVISHDLKAPIRGINTVLGWLGEDDPKLLEGETGEHIDAIKREVARMTTMVDGLLRYARVDQRTAPEAIETTALLRDIVATLVKGGAEIEIPADLPIVKYDNLQLMQVFQNLIDNAIKYSNHAQPRIAVSAAVVEDEVVFYIEDDGPGIPEQHRRRVFEMFHQLHPEQRNSGTGLGLAIVRKIVESNGGRIWADTSRFGGLKMTFTILRKRLPSRTSPGEREGP